MKILVGLAFVFVTSCVTATETQTCAGKDTHVFNKATLNIGKKSVVIEVADTDPLRERGLMCRKSLAENTGMLFVFQENELRNFWMKNTFVALSIGYFDQNKKLIEVLEMTPVKSEMQQDIPQYPSSKAATYALEMPKGWFTKNGIKPGATFTFKKH